MKVGIYDLKDLNGKELAALGVYQQILAFNGIETVKMQAEDANFWDEVRELALFIMRFLHYDTAKLKARDILPIVEKELGIPCFPNLATAWHYDDKAKQYFLMRANGYPMTRSWIFYDRDQAQSWARSARYPVVFKLKTGASSMNVIRVNSPKKAEQLIDRMFRKGLIPQRLFVPGLVRFTHFHPIKEIRHLLGKTQRRVRGLDPHHFWKRHKGYALFQQYLPENSYDTRIIVIGGRAFGFRRFVRTNDFRASGSGKLDFNPNGVDLRFVEMAQKVSRELGFQSMAYDFLYNEQGEPEFCEVSYNYGWVVRGCPGYWDEDMAWHSGHTWPEYFHLVDGLGIPDLRMPQLDD